MATRKTRLTETELKRYRELLLAKRAELIDDLTSIEQEAAESQVRSGDLSTQPIHLADQATDSFDQDFLRTLAENERGILWEIDQALERIEDGTYGICERTDEPIPKKRLDAKLWARSTIEAAREVEAEGPTG